jgi:putative DNA methylase
VPRYGRRLAEGVRRWGEVIRDRAREELGRFYPTDPDGSVPIAYLWARTAICEGPACGVRVPLMRGRWLSRRPGHHVALELLTRDGEIGFAIREGVRDREVGPGTVRRGSLTCPLCGHTTPVGAIRRQAQRQGLPERLLAVVTTRPGTQGRRYRLPLEQDLRAVQEAGAELERRIAAHRGPLSLVPDEPFPVQDSRAFTPGVYGVRTWGDLFTPRQKLALSTLARLVHDAHAEIVEETGDEGLARAITTCLGLTLDKTVDLGSSLTRWKSDAECPVQMYGRQAIPMVWDFAEAIPTSFASGSFESQCQRTVDSLLPLLPVDNVGVAMSGSATSLAAADRSTVAIVTDPPYYDAVPYADLSDFFYVWLRRSIGHLHPDLLASPLTPKDEEIVVNPVRVANETPKDGAFFETHMESAFKEARRVLDDRGVGVVVFAHKTTAGWEAMVQALVSAGWTITGSWPIDTEMGSRLRAMNSAALGSSVHLVCRPRPVDAGVGDWGSILRRLQPRTDEWMRRLARDGVVGADAIFACLGPALELYSRYERVETAAGEVVPLGGRAETGDDFLSHVWAAVARSALRMIFEEADVTGFEPDGRLAAVWLWTLGARATAPNGSNGDEDDMAEAPEEGEEGSPARARPAGFVLPYDTARKLAQPLGADLAVLARRPGAPFQVKKEMARMLSVQERRRFLLGSAPRTAPRARPVQQSLFGGEEEPDGLRPVEPGATTLDRVHQAMVLFAEERGEALRRLLVEDGVGSDRRFWTLANALSALYPSTSPEKRWVDGVLARRRALSL